MTKVALFGGSFNPPHCAHQLVALYVLETCDVDELWFVPTFVHPFGKELAPYDDRIAMCELAARALGPRVRISRAEEQLAAQPKFVSSRTLELVEMLVADQPNDYRLVIGGDILGETHKWYRWDDLAKLAPPIVVGRSGFPLPPGAFLPAEGTGIVMPEISATHVRELLVAGDPRAASLLPRSILRYIADRGLYK